MGSLVKSGYSFAGWSDGVNTIAAGSTLTVGSADITLTAQWTLIPVVVVPVVVPVPVAPTGPPPSILKTISNPKISRDDKGYYCEIGKYIFLREGRTEEVPKLTTQVFYLLQNGKVIESSWVGQPATFPLAQVVEGWQKGLPGAKVGGRRLLVLPPEMGYGAAGAGPIGPNETLIFVVDIIGVA